MEQDQRSGVPLATSLDRASYVEEAVFVREQDEILSRDWFCVGREDAVPEPGDYLCADVAGESILVVRGRDGTLGAFYNLCRHRGSRLVAVDPHRARTAPGATGRFDRLVTCPYHAWAYGLDGSLRAAPHLPEIRPYRDQLSLHRVDLASWAGFAFVRLVAGSAGDDLDRRVEDPGRRLARYPLAELRCGHRIVYEVAANWKVVLENYNECYHCGPVHPELCELVPLFRQGGGAGLGWDDGIPHRDGATTFTLSGTTRRPPFPGLGEDERSRHRGELVLPNLMLSLSADHVAAFTLWPTSTAATTVVCDFLFHPEAMAEASFDPSDAVELWDLVNRQDWSICEQVQDGMRSRRFAFGYLSPMEQPSADVGAYVADRTS